MNYDVQMSQSGDLFISDGDIIPTVSLEQAILIKLRWFLGEWQYGPQYGTDWYGRVFIKNPNTVIASAMLADVIKTVDGVKSVDDIKILVNRETRDAKIYFTVTTIDKETFDQEVDIHSFIYHTMLMRYIEDGADLVGIPNYGTGRAQIYIEDGDLYVRYSGDLQKTVQYSVIDGDLIETGVQV